MLEAPLRRGRGARSASRRFGVAHCDAEDTAEEVAREIRQRYPEIRRHDRGVRAGARGAWRPGAIAVAVLP
jgi:hypothetical protein